mmetsp:Transcript_12992/g.40336  ORF Transcript_12992/g.40336 Transcript_12992/m.40336 type:complete len:274 (-) Transcript_12992:1207-2028(-)
MPCLWRCSKAHCKSSKTAWRCLDVMRRGSGSETEHGRNASAGAPKLWIGSTGATTRGWSGRNARLSSTVAAFTVQTTGHVTLRRSNSGTESCMCGTLTRGSSTPHTVTFLASESRIAGGGSVNLRNTKVAAAFSGSTPREKASHSTFGRGCERNTTFTPGNLTQRPEAAVAKASITLGEPFPCVVGPTIPATSLPPATGRREHATASGRSGAFSRVPVRGSSTPSCRRFASSGSKSASVVAASMRRISPHERVTADGSNESPTSDRSCLRIRR